MKKLISTQLVNYLEDRNVDHIFGLCGHTNIAVLSELDKSSIKFINVRHEQIASHAADGYARAKKDTAVVLSHLGPGLTNAATGVANAALDSIPMVVIAGDVPSHYYGKHPHQEVNLHADGAQFEIYRPFVKRAWRVDRPDLFPEILQKAFQLAESGRPGPVLVSVPMDIFSKEVDTSLFEKLKHHTRVIDKPSLDEETAERMVHALADAKRPVIYAGGGVVLADATEELQTFVDHMNIPVAHSLMGKGVLPDDHPLTLGMTGFWGTKFINDQTKNADYLFGLGTSFKEADSSSWYPGVTFDIPATKLIQIDIDPNEIGRNYPVEIGATADLKRALIALIRVAKRLYPNGIDRNEKLKEDIQTYRKELRSSISENMNSDAFPMKPERILADVREVLPRDAYITTDVGWNKNGVGQQFPIYTPGSILTPGGYATMGFGSSAALGAKLAQPEKTVVSLIGDGGFGQNPAVLATAVEENIPVVWIVMNNSAYGTIAGLEMAHYDTTYGTLFKKGGETYTPNFAAIAEGFGVKGIKVQSAEEFKGAVKEAIDANEPVVIDVAMRNEPVPTDGQWNINDIYSPNSTKSHVSIP
ncbi:thiamine pyrophosphate-requiring enzyme [Geomicrobium sp. JCM 19037]|uniref:thiamine pyrophosphate-binding protein n=1 Tax=Geomicrobium sp. JCM 19037 TaxID=1460634 RepID=UPI00045F230F|nr:thiamine pyrophosphate-binding protein [Geomicrobium sp. JCM 19037]GAK03461.1 thiamine pyrophosphate-requiring enzyme [Geomicrobium sp. JCM 19037]